MTRRRRHRLDLRSDLQRESPRATLARLLDAPNLPEHVKRLPEREFTALIQHVGVRDAGEVLALATTQPLQAALDDDLFVNAQPGAPEILDGGRFVLWLEVLLEAGDGATAARLSALSEDYLALAISKVLIVIDATYLYAPKSQRAREVISGEELDSVVTAELCGHLLVERLDVGWDAVLQALFSLDQDHHEFLMRVLARCAALSNEYIEDEDELLEVSPAEEALAEDVREERERRRDAMGYVDSRSAQAFLRLARLPLGDDASADARDIISKAHLTSDSAVGADAGTSTTTRQARLTPGSSAPGAPQTPTAAQDGADEVAHVAQLAQPSVALSQDRTTPFDEALSRLAERAPEALASRLQELAYLANVLLAGASVVRRRFSQSAAAEAALATVTLGAEPRGPARGGMSQK